MNTQTEKELQCKIIMLPVNGAKVFDNTALLMHYKELFLMQKADTLTDEAMANCQHLYLVPTKSELPNQTDDTEIKVGDWVIWNNSNTVEKVKRVGLDLLTFESTHLNGYIENCKKIIATTDLSLGLPGIPRSYIEKMVEQNNTAITDRDEWVEIVDNGHEEWFVPSDGSEGEPFWNEKIEVKFKK